MRHQNIQQSAHLPLKNPEDGTFASAWSPTAYTAGAVQSHVYPPLMRYPAKIESKASVKRRIVMPVSSPQGFGTFLPSPSSDSGISTDSKSFNANVQMCNYANAHYENYTLHGLHGCSFFQWTNTPIVTL